MYFRLQLLHLSARKGLICCIAARTVNFVIPGAKTRVRKRAGRGVQEMLLLVTDAPSTGIDLLEKLSVVAVKLFGIDTHDWA
jgi:predicted nuclease with TOPRIM domain